MATDHPHPAQDASGVSRRSFIKTVGLSAAGASVSTAAQAIAAGGSSAGPTVLGPDAVEVTLKVNGKPLKASIDPATTLLEALRQHHNMTGTKEVCDRAACGACSVIMDGKLVTSCMILALDAAGSEITTVEGLGSADELDPVQRGFVQHDAMQCGFCTPGFVMACRAVLNENPKPTLDQIKAGCAGNICRCGCYTNIFNACLEASGQPPVMEITKV
ncbi:MAG: (2Fe-2S)-binding protein [Phycisphaerales bacterium]